MRFAAWIELWRVSVLLIVGVAIGGSVGQWWGRTEGAQLERGRAAERQVSGLQELIDSHADQVREAKRASAGMRRAQTARDAADLKSTKELRDALATNAGRRGGCDLDPGELRQLTEARDRAAAAAAGGSGAALPGAGGAGEREAR